MGFQARQPGFAIETVDGCPVTKGSEGVMTFTADQIAMVAGAVRDKIEWMVLLHGERSEDGYEVKVTRFTVPAQYRSAGEVELAEDITLPEDCVGVMHSHHRMGAFFSTTDRDELNPRFPSSIVVAIAANNLGFKYRACGKVVLPCGAMGLVDFELAIEGDRKFVAQPIRGQHSAFDPKDTEPLKGCTRRAYAVHPDDDYLALDQTQCGLTVGEVVERPLLFGMNGSELLAAVVAQTRQPVSRQLPAHYTGGGSTHSSGYTRVDDEPAKGRKKGKDKGKRNGLVKLERPMPARPGQPLEGQCDDCSFADKLTWIAENREWLCDECIEERAEVYLAGEDPGTDQELVVTDQINMGEEFGGWGI